MTLSGFVCEGLLFSLLKVEVSVFVDELIFSSLGWCCIIFSLSHGEQFITHKGHVYDKLFVVYFSIVSKDKHEHSACHHPLQVSQQIHFRFLYLEIGGVSLSHAIHISLSLSHVLFEFVDLFTLGLVLSYSTSFLLSISVCFFLLNYFVLDKLIHFLPLFFRLLLLKSGIFSFWKHSQI